MMRQLRNSSRLIFANVRRMQRLRQMLRPRFRCSFKPSGSNQPQRRKRLA
jgi:hypothetical protein